MIIYFIHANPKDLTVGLSEINFLPYWVFWMGLVIWLLLIYSREAIQPTVHFNL